MTIDELEFDLINKPNGYGFGSDWSLQVTEPGGEVHNFYLGQDAKYCSRVLGADIGYLVDRCEDETGSRDFSETKVRDWIINIILDVITDGSMEVRGILSLEAWELSCE